MAIGFFHSWCKVCLIFFPWLVLMGANQFCQCFPRIKLWLCQFSSLYVFLISLITTFIFHNFIVLSLSIVCPSFCNYLRWTLRSIVISTILPNNTLKAIHLHLNTYFAIFRKFLYIKFSLSFNEKYFLIFIAISFLTR